MLEIKGQRILLDGLVVGIYNHFKTPSVPTRQILEMFDDECGKAIKKVVQRRSLIDYVWVSDIAIRPKWRRQGLATRVLDKVSKPGTLVACAPGSGVKGGMRMKAAERLEFYQALGFTIVYGTKHDYAFRFTP